MQQTFQIAGIDNESNLIIKHVSILCESNLISNRTTRVARSSQYYQCIIFCAMFNCGSTAVSNQRFKSSSRRVVHVYTKAPAQGRTRSCDGTTSQGTNSQTELDQLNASNNYHPDVNKEETTLGKPKIDI